MHWLQQKVIAMSRWKGKATEIFWAKREVAKDVLIKCHQNSLIALVDSTDMSWLL